MRDAVFCDLTGVMFDVAVGADIVLVVCDKLSGRGCEKLAGDGLCGRDASEVARANPEDPDTWGPVLCDLSIGEALLSGLARLLLRGGWTIAAGFKVATSCVWCCMLWMLWSPVSER
jgi:hypothetical protein